MSTGDARRSQLANFFRSSRKVGQETNQRSKQFLQEDENTHGIVLDATLTSTLIGEEPRPI